MSRPSERAVRAAGRVLAKIGAYDPHFPKPSESVLLAWGEHISLKAISEEDMLDAVTEFYATCEDGQKPLPASISTLALKARRDRSLRETPAQRQEREDRLDAKAEGREYVKRLPSSGEERITLEEWERRHGERFPTVALGLEIPAGPNPLKVRCPWCKVSASRRCVVPATQIEMKGFHDARVALASGDRCASWANVHADPHSEGCEYA